MCMVSNLEIIDLLKMSAYDIVPCGNLCYICMTHGIFLFVGHPTYVKLSQSKEMNYKLVEKKLKICWK